MCTRSHAHTRAYVCSYVSLSTPQNLQNYYYYRGQNTDFQQLTNSAPSAESARNARNSCGTPWNQQFQHISLQARQEGRFQALPGYVRYRAIAPKRKRQQLGIKPHHGPFLNHSATPTTVPLIGWFRSMNFTNTVLPRSDPCPRQNSAELPILHPRVAPDGNWTKQACKSPFASRPSDRTVASSVSQNFNLSKSLLRPYL